ncbi:MAG: sulfurtransferase [Gammaproteobacteria bacterium]|nr:sulfurtransferase [Gammaproteobacteria bacterium]
MVREIESSELERMLSSEERVYLLDIRTEAEVVHGMLPSSTHLPMHLIPLRMNEFPTDREIVLYCRSGARSYHACIYLMQQGFNNVINLKGGIIDWVRNRFDVVAYG